MSIVTLGWPLAALLIALTGIAALLVQLSGLGRGGSVLAIALRAVVQLAAVSVVIGFVLRSLGWTFAFLGLMVVIAAGTSARRITGGLAPRSWWTALAIVVAVVPTLAGIVLSTAVPAAPIALLPIAGILIGGAMSATTLAGRRLTEQLTDRRELYEAALAIGATRRQAVRLVARPAAALALVPGQDQTRTVGLVTLPGAFVGVLLAGASPLAAGASQLLVLIALLVVQSAAVAVTVEIVAGGLLPVGGHPLSA